MSIVVEFKRPASSAPRRPNDPTATGQIVIFPGVRIERHELDLGHRIRNSAGSDEFDGLGPDRRPRQSS